MRCNNAVLDNLCEQICNNMQMCYSIVGYVEGDKGFDHLTLLKYRFLMERK